MLHQKFSRLLVLFSTLFVQPLYASFIEATMGTAVINDATAAYYNPAALSLLKNKQAIALGSLGVSQTTFSGQSTQVATGFTQSGTSAQTVNYFLPSLYVGLPTAQNWFFGLAVVGNSFSNDLDGRSILRYAQSNFSIQDVDVVPAVGYKVSDKLSLGASVTYSSAHFLLDPVIGFPSLNIPDARSTNQTSGEAFGGDAGILLRPIKPLLIGFNYRSAITYPMSGKSIFQGATTVVSNDYSFTYWTPARNVLSMTFFQTEQLSYIGTVQYVQWSIFKNLTARNIATPNGVVAVGELPYHFHDTWSVTFGANYRASKKWVIRGAGTYAQAPSRGEFQIDTGDNFTLGISVGYSLGKHAIIDGSYAHVFVRDEPIRVSTLPNRIEGTNKQAINAVALKLTVM